MSTGAFYEIPTSGGPASFTITLNNVIYRLRLNYRDYAMGGWTLDIADTDNINLACGIPLVTGCNLLDQYEYLGLGGIMIVTTDGDTLAPPTYDNLGVDSHLYFGVRVA